MTHTITEATRDEALRILKEGRPGCEIEKLLGWTQRYGMTEKEMADRLRLKKSRVHYTSHSTLDVARSQEAQSRETRRGSRFSRSPHQWSRCANE